MKAYRVEWSQDPGHVVYVRAESRGAARMDRARDLHEVCDTPIGTLLRELQVTRAPHADPFQSSRQDQRIHGFAFCPGRIPDDGNGNPVRADQPWLDVAEFNVRAPVGTSVRYWTGAREGEGKTGRIRHEATVVSEHAVAWIEGCASCVSLTHVEVEVPHAP